MRASLTSVKSLVVKLGSQVLSDGEKRLDAAFLADIARQVAALRAGGVAVTLVSSGAISAGVNELRLPARPKDLATLQAVAAVGQRKLMDAWADAFAPHNIAVAQVLLTREDIDVRQRFLNLRNTVQAVQRLGAVPVINENDTISTDELVRISFGDNDLLAALVATALRAEVLVLLSVVDGIAGTDGQPVRTIENTDAARSLVRTDRSALGKGGMNSKLDAARLVTGAGETLIVAHGRAPDVLPRLLAGEELGTIFLPARTGRAAGRSRWIKAARPAGTLTLDAGATRAVVERNTSLLAAGVVAVDGAFGRGDVVALVSPDNQPIGRGLVNYDSADLLLIAGKKTADVRALLPGRAYDEVVHRDNLVKG